MWFSRAQATARWVNNTLRRRPSFLPFFALALVALPVAGCATANRILFPNDTAREEREEKERAELMAIPDGECDTAELCKYRCEHIERALDCYKTGKAALKGVDVHYAGGWKVEKVAGSTDDLTAHYEGASEEHSSLMPLARESFTRACAANHAESCRILGRIVEDIEQDRKKRGIAPPSDEATSLSIYQKACALHDEPACTHLAGKK